MNYNSLVSDLKTYMLREDDPYVAKIPDIIEQGIIRIYNTARDIGFQLTYTDKINLGEFEIEKPSNWRETVSLSVIDASGEETFLEERTYEYCRTYLSNKNILGVPKYYSENNNTPYETWFICPSVSAQSYDVNVIYLGIPLFDANHPVNFLTQRYPNLLLYSCLMEAALFLDNEAKQAKYEMMFGKELETINNISQDRMTDRTVNINKS